MSTIAAATPDVDPVQFLKIAGQGAHECQDRGYTDFREYLF